MKIPICSGCGRLNCPTFADPDGAKSADNCAGARRAGFAIIADICEMLSVAGSAYGLEGNHPEPVDGLRALLDHFAEVRRERDNLAGTVELCCLPVEGEASMCDRVRAAGEAQRELKRLRDGDTWNDGPR